MKTKGLFLALAAIVFAMGSAFTSKNVNLGSPNVKVWIKQYPWNSYVCTAIPIECNQFFLGQLCQVHVVTLNGFPKTVKAYSYGNEAPACSVQLRHTLWSSIAGTYDANFFDEDRPFDVTDF